MGSQRLTLTNMEIWHTILCKSLLDLTDINLVNGYEILYHFCYISSSKILSRNLDKQYIERDNNNTEFHYLIHPNNIKVYSYEFEYKTIITSKITNGTFNVNINYWECIIPSNRALIIFETHYVFDTLIKKYVEIN